MKGGEETTTLEANVTLFKELWTHPCVAASPPACPSVCLSIRRESDIWFESSLVIGKEYSVKYRALLWDIMVSVCMPKL